MFVVVLQKARELVLQLMEQKELEVNVRVVNQCKFDVHYVYLSRLVACRREV